MTVRKRARSRGHFSPLSPPLSGEALEEVCRTGSFRVERIISSDFSSPPSFWYDQEEDEWVVLLSGEGTLEFEDGSLERLREGDWIFLPARLRHRVAATTQDPPCVWLAVFGLPLPDEG